MKRIKTGGRQKGTPNKATAMTKGVISTLLADYSDSGMMRDDFLALDPKDRMVVVMFAIFSFMMGILYAKSHLSYIPWAADVALVAFFFTIAGWMCKKIKLGSVKKTTAFFCAGGGTLCFELLLEQYSS